MLNPVFTSLAPSLAPSRNIINKLSGKYTASGIDGLNNKSDTLIGLQETCFQKMQNTYPLGPVVKWELCAVDLGVQGPSRTPHFWDSDAELKEFSTS